jgi:hypothetical protein
VYAKRDEVAAFLERSTFSKHEIPA